MSILVSTPSSRLLPAIWKLLRMRILITWNSFKHAKVGRKILIILGYVGLLIFAAAIFVGSWLLLNFLRSPQLTKYVGLNVTPFLEAVPVLIFTTLFLGILLSSFGVLLQALYLSGDMDFLLASPVPLRAVFVTKLLQAVLPNFSLIALFGLPVLFGLGVANHYNILYYPLVLLVMIALTLAAAGLSAILVMLVARVFPPRRVAEVLGFLTALITITCSQIGNLTNAFTREANISGQQVDSLFAMLIRFNTPWFPLNWAGQGLVALGAGNWLTGLLLTVLTLGLSSVAFMFALATAERWYYSGWAGMQVIARKKKPTRTVQPATVKEATTLPWAARLVPAPVRGIIRKDFVLLRRDLRNLSQLISPLIFGVLYTAMFLRPGHSMFPDTPDMPGALVNISNLITTYGSIGMSLFVGWMLTARLSGMAFSSEGKNYWMLKSAPIRSSYLLLSKFIVAYLPPLALGLVFLVGISIMQKIPAGGFLYSLLALVMCLAGMDGILLSFGVAGANFKWEDPRKMSSGGLGCLGQFLTMLFLPLAFGLFIGPLLLVNLFHWPQGLGYLIGAIAGTAISGLGAILPPLLVQKKVERLAEE